MLGPLLGKVLVLILVLPMNATDAKFRKTVHETLMQNLPALLRLLCPSPCGCPFYFEAVT